VLETIDPLLATTTPELGATLDSVMELFMDGGNYLASGISFPIAFTNSIDAEIIAAKQIVILTCCS
jgi:hypothetical protein